jgi:hypothetical protein
LGEPKCVVAGNNIQSSDRIAKKPNKSHGSSGILPRQSMVRKISCRHKRELYLLFKKHIITTSLQRSIESALRNLCLEFGRLDHPIVKQRHKQKLMMCPRPTLLACLIIIYYGPQTLNGDNVYK